MPRSGVFWGVHPPLHHSTIVIGELGEYPDAETLVRSWYEPHVHYPEQTNVSPFQMTNSRIQKYMLALTQISSAQYIASTATTGFVTSLDTHAAHLDFLRNVDVACAFIPRRIDLTESPWLNLRDALSPLLRAPKAILEAIRTELEHRRVKSAQPQHIGLTAVAWLTRALDLPRPTVLRMGGVPDSTFYFWKKHPQKSTRLSSVTRILRLQAQLDVLERAVGKSGLKAWLLSSDHLEKLQGDDEAFMEAIADAESTVTTAIHIAPRQRMRLEDYRFEMELPTESKEDEFPSWPAISRLPEELAE